LILDARKGGFYPKTLEFIYCFPRIDCEDAIIKFHQGEYLDEKDMKTYSPKKDYLHFSNQPQFSFNHKYQITKA